MKCPNCGAENEAEARFCAECGTPLEKPASTGSVTVVDTPETDNDATILSSYSSMMAEQAKTVSVSQDEVAAAEAEAGGSDWEEPAPVPPPPPVSPPPPGGTGGRNLFTQRNIIIAIIVLVLLCCCCAAIAIGATMATNGDFDINNFSMLPVSLALI